MRNVDTRLKICSQIEQVVVINAQPLGEKPKENNT